MDTRFFYRFEKMCCAVLNQKLLDRQVDSNSPQSQRLPLLFHKGTRLVYHIFPNLADKSVSFRNLYHLSRGDIAASSIRQTNQRFRCRKTACLHLINRLIPYFQCPFMDTVPDQLKNLSLSPSYLQKPVVKDYDTVRHPMFRHLAVVDGRLKTL